MNLIQSIDVSYNYVFLVTHTTHTITKNSNNTHFIARDTSCQFLLLEVIDGVLVAVETAVVTTATVATADHDLARVTCLETKRKT